VSGAKAKGGVGTHSLAWSSVLRQDATRSVSIDQPAIASASTSSGFLYGASGSFATFRGIILV
jgi:hypothetical protein